MVTTAIEAYSSRASSSAASGTTSAEQPPRRGGRRREHHVGVQHLRVAGRPAIRYRASKMHVERFLEHDDPNILLWVWPGFPESGCFLGAASVERYFAELFAPFGGQLSGRARGVHRGGGFSGLPGPPPVLWADGAAPRSAVGGIPSSTPCVRARSSASMSMPGVPRPSKPWGCRSRRCRRRTSQLVRAMFRRLQPWRLRRRARTSWIEDIEWPGASYSGSSMPRYRLYSSRPKQSWSLVPCPVVPRPW